MTSKPMFFSQWPLAAGSFSPHVFCIVLLLSSLFKSTQSTLRLTLAVLVLPSPCLCPDYHLSQLAILFGDLNFYIHDTGNPPSKEKNDLESVSDSHSKNTPRGGAVSNGFYSGPMVSLFIYFFCIENMKTFCAEYKQINK